MKKIYLLIPISLFIIFASCNNVDKQDNGKDNENIEQKNDPASEDWITVETHKPDELRVFMPDSIAGYQIAPFSEFSSKEKDRIIHTAKYQFYNNETGESVVIDITDYGNLDLVPFSHIYSNPPEGVNVATDTLATQFYKGYMTWSPVDYTGKVNVLSQDRFVVKIRSSAKKDTIADFLKNILSKIDFEGLSKIENQ